MTNALADLQDRTFARATAATGSSGGQVSRTKNRSQLADLHEQNLISATYAAGVFKTLAEEHYLRGLPRDTFVDRLTHYIAEVNALHPFREGNGRTQRAFFRQLSREAGGPVDWSALDPAENETASIASLRGENAPLRAMLEALVTH